MNREVHVRFWERAEVKFLRATRQKHPLPRCIIAVRSTSVNGHSARRGTAGLVEFMTIRPAYPSRFSSLHSRFSLGKNDYFTRSPLTIVVRLAKLPPASRRGHVAPHQPADPWQGGLPDRMWSSKTANQRSVCLSLVPRRRVTWRHKSNLNRASVSIGGNCWHQQRLSALGRSPVLKLPPRSPIQAKPSSQRGDNTGIGCPSPECMRRDR